MAQAPILTVRDEWDASAAIVTVQGQIDITTVGILSDRLSGLVRKNPERLVVDLAGVSFLDSSAVHAIVSARLALRPECPVVLRSPQRQARRVFELIGLDAVTGH